MDKVIQVLKRFGAFLLSFVLICAFVGGTIGAQVVSWSAKLHPGESWWTLAIASLIISGFAAYPMFRAVKALVRIMIEK